MFEAHWPLALRIAAIAHYLSFIAPSARSVGCSLSRLTPTCEDSCNTPHKQTRPHPHLRFIQDTSLDSLLTLDDLTSLSLTTHQSVIVRHGTRLKTEHTCSEFTSGGARAEREDETRMCSLSRPSPNPRHTPPPLTPNPPLTCLDVRHSSSSSRLRFLPAPPNTWPTDITCPAASRRLTHHRSSRVCC